MRSDGGRSGSVVRTQKQCTRRPPGRTSSAPRLPHQPDAEPAALEREAGVALELARLVAEQVAEQALGDRLGALVARALGPQPRWRRGRRRARG